MIILEENFKWHLEAFASELFIYILQNIFYSKTARKWKPKMWTSCVPYFRL